MKLNNFAAKAGRRPGAAYHPGHGKLSAPCATGTMRGTMTEGANVDGQGDATDVRGGKP
jgi:hypothetical protein